MPAEEENYNGFYLSSTQDRRNGSNTIFYRLHAVKSEAEVFTVRPCMTEDYVDSHKEMDHFAVLKEDATREAKRRIDENDFEAKATYESVFSTKEKTPYKKVVG